MLSGARGFQILARRLGVELSQAQFNDIKDIDKKELDFDTLRKLSKTHHLVCRYLKTNISSLGEASKKQPTLCLLDSGRYVIVLNIVYSEDNSGIVSLLDPSEQQPRPKKIDVKEFSRSWSGQALIFQKSRKLEQESGELNLSAVFRDLLENKFVLIQLIIIALFINIFALSPIIFLIIVLDKVVNYEAYSTLYVVASGVVLAHIFNLILSFLKANIISLSAAKIEARYGVEIFGKIIDLPLSTLQNQSDQIRKLTQNLGQVRSTIISKVLGSISDIVSVIFFVPILFFYSPLLGTVVLTFCFLGSTITFLHSKAHKVLAEATSTSDMKRQNLLKTTVEGFEDIKRLGLESELYKEWKELEGSYLRFNEKSSASSAFINEFGSLLNNILTVVVLFIGVHLVFSGSLSAGVLIGVNMLIGKIYRPTLNLVKIPSDLKQFSNLLSVLNRSSSMSSENKGRGQFHSIEGGITFQNVSFSFDPSKTIISDLSLSIGAGEIVGICGPSGSGKTVVTQLMQGLYNPASGKVFIDGNDLRTINLQHLRSQVALVSGTQYFFDGTIRDNMQRVFPNATNDRIVWACKLACVDQDIEKLSEGYDSQLTDDASSLSPAVKQKLAIARALIRNPKVLVLDDIFANLDIQNELMILDGISDLAKGRTLIIISQQIWYLKYCRKIIFMEDGKIKQMGTPKEVMSQDGPIQNFSNQQLKIISNRFQGQHNLIFDEMKN